MFKVRVVRLVVLATCTTFLFGGCAGSGLLPWVVGLGLFSQFSGALQT